MNGAPLCVREAGWSDERAGPILHPVSFELEAGQVLGVAGPNGAGKSTLLRLLYRYRKPQCGSVSVDGRDLWSMTARQAARQIAAVLQEQPTDFALSVREIVELGRRPHGSSFARSGTRDAGIVGGALERLGLSDLAERSFGTLSGGERQRVMVARALAQEPRVLVLDEPTNHLDIRQQLEIVSLIADLDITVVTSLHDLNLAFRICDRVLLLHRGRAVAFGSPADVLTSGNIEQAFAVKVRQDTLAAGSQPHLTFHLHS